MLFVVLACSVFTVPPSAPLAPSTRAERYASWVKNTLLNATDSDRLRSARSQLASEEERLLAIRQAKTGDRNGVKIVGKYRIETVRETFYVGSNGVHYVRSDYWKRKAIRRLEERVAKLRDNVHKLQNADPQAPLPELNILDLSLGQFGKMPAYRTIKVHAPPKRTWTGTGWAYVSPGLVDQRIYYLYRVREILSATELLVEVSDSSSMTPIVLWISGVNTTRMVTDEQLRPDDFRMLEIVGRKRRCDHLGAEAICLAIGILRSSLDPISHG
jgi:hypothetical protein